MGMTMTQKILAAHAGLPTVSAGELIEAELDLVLGNDITSPVAIHEMDKMKADCRGNLKPRLSCRHARRHIRTPDSGGKCAQRAVCAGV